MMFALAQGLYSVGTRRHSFGTLYAAPSWTSRGARSADTSGLLHDRARFVRVVHPGDLDAHDALVQQKRNIMDKRLVDAHNR